MDNYIELPTDQQVHDSLKNLVDTLNHYIRKSNLLIELCYEKNISQTTIGNKLGVTKQAVSLAHPKGGSK